MAFDKLFRTLQCSILFTLFVVPTLSSARDAVPGEFIVRYKSGVSSFQALGKAKAQNNLSLHRSWNQIGAYHLKASSMNLPSPEEDARTLAALRANPDVLMAEPNYYVYATYSPLTGSDVDAPDSWVSSLNSGAPVVVAVLDSGLDINHELFNGTGRLWDNVAEVNGLPGVDDDGNGYIDDFHGWNFLSDNNSLSDSSGHGSHVAGTVVGATEDISQVSSTSDDERVKVMVLKFLDGDGVGTTADAIEAIQYAVDNGAKILNNSWGGTGYSALLHEAVVYSFFQNTLFVAAAGNNGSNNDQQAIYPASYDVPNVLSVAATNDQDDLAFFSNFGSESVDVAAPGVNIVSVAPGGGFYSSSGTSMATPFTAGLAALMVQEAPHFSGFQLKRDIIASVDTFASLSGRMVSGGRVNFLSAVNLAIANSGEATFLPDYTPNYDYSSRDLASLSDGDDGGFGCGRVKNLYEHQNNQIERSSMTLNQVFALTLLFMPILVLAYFRKKMKNRRRYKRYQVKFDAVLKTQSGEAIEVEVVCFSIGGAGVRIKKTGAKISLHHEMELFLDTDSGKRAFTCRAVSNFNNHFGLCFD